RGDRSGLRGAGLGAPPLPRRPALRARRAHRLSGALRGADRPAGGRCAV
ncbi:hypothetical protein HMPREF9005_0784, partial [Actinomyces sp. oral taxon 178 str. F0338]